MDVKRSDGGTLRDHLKTVARATGKAPIELKDLPELPESAAHIWEWFLELNSSRGVTQFGESALTYLEIWAWQELLLTRPSPWEITAIKALDIAYLSRKEK